MTPDEKRFAENVAMGNLHATIAAGLAGTGHTAEAEPHISKAQEFCSAAESDLESIRSAEP